MDRPGPILLFGSGETSPSAQPIHDAAMRSLDKPVRAVILETPAGFEPNSHAVAQHIGDYLHLRLRNYAPDVAIIPARRSDGPLSTNQPDLAEPIFHANYLFMGPGSPTYAVRHLRDSYIWFSLLAQHRMGAALCLASAATLAASRYTLPVYEIYKVGEDLHWQPGLDFFSAFGLALVLIPHWNNSDGGAALDTSRAYIGAERFERLAAMLPPHTVILGIDENTGLLIEPAAALCSVIGVGGATIVHAGGAQHFTAGTTFDAAALGSWRLPMGAELGGQATIPPEIWQRAQAAAARRAEPAPQVPAHITRLLEAREDARHRRDWAGADALRAEIEQMGWQVQDTAAGSVLLPLPKHTD